jgi:hypothetical protein
MNLKTRRLKKIFFYFYVTFIYIGKGKILCTQEYDS